MVDILQLLRHEHVNIAALIRTLEWQVGQFEKGERPDYDVIRATLDYFLSYPDLYHHPKEDMVFAMLAERDPETVRRIGDLRQEHEKLAARSREFAEGLRAVLDEAQVPRESFLNWAHAFIALQWQHMNMEEQTFFPAAERSLSPADWEELKQRMTRDEDPLFGEKVGERFERLHKKIMEWQAEDRAAAKD